MLPAYDDILKLTAEPPKWFDENGVPRYAPFHPHMLASIYLSEGALLDVSCQLCERRFQAAVSAVNSWEQMKASNDRPERSLTDLIRGREVHYGDPPNVGCCEHGAFSSSVPHRVLEFWTRRADITLWVRDSSLEIDLDAG